MSKNDSSSVTRLIKATVFAMGVITIVGAFVTLVAIGATIILARRDADELLADSGFSEPCATSMEQAFRSEAEPEASIDHA